MTAFAQSSSLILQGRLKGVSWKLPVNGGWHRTQPTLSKHAFLGLLYTLFKNSTANCRLGLLAKAIFIPRAATSPSSTRALSKLSNQRAFSNSGFNMKQPQNSILRSNVVKIQSVEEK